MSSLRHHAFRHATLVVLNLAAVVDAADGALLHAVFRALEADLQLGPTALSKLALLQSLSMAIAAPIWGFLSDTWPRRSLLALNSPEEPAAEAKRPEQPSALAVAAAKRSLDAPKNGASGGGEATKTKRS